MISKNAAYLECCMCRMEYNIIYEQDEVTISGTSDAEIEDSDID